MRYFYLFAFVACVFGTPLFAQGPDESGPSGKTEPSAHTGETGLFKDTLPGEWSFTHFLTWSPRFITLTDTRGFTNTFSKRIPEGLHYLALRGELAMEYRIDEEWTLGVRPTAWFGYGYSGFRGHEKFLMQSTGLVKPVRSSFQINHLSFDLGVQVGARKGEFEGFLDINTITAFRFSRIRVANRKLINPNTGFVDNVKSPTRNETSRAIVYSWGLGFGYYADVKDWNYRTSVIIHPATRFEFEEHDATLPGFGFDFRAGGLRLSDDLDLALLFRWDYFFRGQDFRKLHFVEFGVGIRFS